MSTLNKEQAATAYTIGKAAADHWLKHAMGSAPLDARSEWARLERWITTQTDDAAAADEARAFMYLFAPQYALNYNNPMQ